MLFRQSVLEGILRGEVTLAFRRWRRAAPAPGSTFRTAIGVLSLGSVREIQESDITEGEARRSGAASRAELLGSLRAEGSLFRVEVRYLGPDPRALTRDEPLAGADDAAGVSERLRRLDARAPAPWTGALLHLVDQHPGVAARELARLVEMETSQLKRRIRRLKELGLTESLAVGYRLSRRGRDVLERAVGPPAPGC